ncbi:MAG: 2-hydroxyglutaryl-CoA dehydratase [Deltaproteobacteria bacterium]|nr:2-hydroxyglutaryl-CoA dehydratase [Deltaproteobacteria bacterium]
MTAVAAIGVDAGSTAFKLVAIDAAGVILSASIEPAHPKLEAQAERLLALVRARFPEAEAAPLVATGYGRKRIPARAAVTEITCHARGSFFHLKRPHLLIDVGGQDTKAIRVGAEGEVLDFAMNDKCAAGTGRFLEVILARLAVPLAEVALHTAGAEPAVTVSNTCTVFAESEVVSLLAEGAPLEGVLRGLHESLASRVAQLAGRFVDDPRIGLSGGVALNPAMRAALTVAVGRPIEVVPDPQLVGALGAALSALLTKAGNPATR